MPKKTITTPKGHVYERYAANRIFKDNFRQVGERTWKRVSGLEGRARPRLRLSNFWKGHFKAGASIVSRSGWLSSWSRPLAYSKGGLYSVGKGWYARIGSRGTGADVIPSTRWASHFAMIAHRFVVASENYRVVVTNRALKIFDDAFAEHRFVNEGGGKWPELADFTVRKRIKKHKKMRVVPLVEYGKLRGSIHSRKINSITTRIQTDKVSTNRGVFSYAAVHNEGVPKGMKWGKAVPQRKFMGFDNASRMDMVDRFAASIATRYLLDDVFVYKS